VLQAEGYRLLIMCQFRLAGKVKKSSSLGQRWLALEAEPSVDVPGVGSFARLASGWFSFESERTADREGMTQFLVEVGRSVIEFLRSVDLDPSSTKAGE
jgi:hypothetical protein